MANYPTFPVFHDHYSAANWGCFQCSTPLTPNSEQDKGYPPGLGKFGAKCPRCGATSFYDIVKDHPAENANELARLTMDLKR